MRSSIVPVVAAVLGLTLAACSNEDAPSSSDGTSSATRSPTAAAPFRVVVIGDSLPYNSDQDCPGCRGFADTYGEALEGELDRPVEVQNLSRHDGARTRDIADQLQSGDLRAALSRGDLVIVSVGFNDQPPYAEAGQPCASATDTDRQAIRALQATTRPCVDQAMKSLRAHLVTVLTEVHDQAPDARTATLVPYNSWTGWSALSRLLERQRHRIDAVVTYALDRWRTALCTESRAANAVCIDTYRAFNGSRGLKPAGPLLARDYTHPSQRGNDTIRDLLLQARLTD